MGGNLEAGVSGHIGVIGRSRNVNEVSRFPANIPYAAVLDSTDFSKDRYSSGGKKDLNWSKTYY